MLWVTLLGPSTAFGAESFIFYFPSRHETLPLRQVGQSGYLPLEKTLRLFGRPDAKRERQRRVSWRLNRRRLEVRAGQTRVRIGRKRVHLPFPVQHLDGEWWVPISFLTEVLPEIIPDALEYHAGTRRIFIGDVEPNSFELRFDPLPGGARLTLQFLQPTSISTAEIEGNWTLYLGGRPLQPPQPRFEFSHPVIKSLAFDDQDGRPKLILTPGPDQMTLRPVVTEGGKMLILDVAPSDAARFAEGRTLRAPESIAPGGLVVGADSLPAVVLDPGHGGIDPGVQGRNGLSEKDWTWQFTYQVRLALIATGKFRVVLTRNGDQLRSLDQRAITANTNRGAVFVSFIWVIPERESGPWLPTSTSRPSAATRRARASLSASCPGRRLKISICPKACGWHNTSGMSLRSSETLQYANPFRRRFASCGASIPLRQ